MLTTVSTPEKAKIAAEAGADDIILYKDVDFQAEVMRLTQNRGCQVVYGVLKYFTVEYELYPDIHRDPIDYPIGLTFMAFIK